MGVAVDAGVDVGAAVGVAVGAVVGADVGVLLELPQAASIGIRNVRAKIRVANLYQNLLFRCHINILLFR